jgi:hypothetical protein
LLYHIVMFNLKKYFQMIYLLPLLQIYDFCATVNGEKHYPLSFNTKKGGGKEENPIISYFLKDKNPVLIERDKIYYLGFEGENIELIKFNNGEIYGLFWQK